MNTLHHVGGDYHAVMGEEGLNWDERQRVWTSDRRKEALTLAELKTGYVYELTLANIASASGDSLAKRLICYTLESGWGPK